MKELSWEKRYTELYDSYTLLEEKYKQLKETILGSAQALTAESFFTHFNNTEQSIIRAFLFSPSGNYITLERLFLIYSEYKQQNINAAYEGNSFKVCFSRIKKKLANIDCYILSSNSVPCKYLMDDYDKILLCKFIGVDPIKVLGLNPDKIKKRKYDIVFARYKYSPQYVNQFGITQQAKITENQIIEREPHGS